MFVDKYFSVGLSVVFPFAILVACMSAVSVAARVCLRFDSVSPACWLFT